MPVRIPDQRSTDFLDTGEAAGRPPPRAKALSGRELRAAMPRALGTWGGRSTVAFACAGGTEDPPEVRHPRRASGSLVSSLARAAEDRLHIEHRRSVQGLEIAHLDAYAVDCQDLHAMQSDRIRAIR